MIDFLTSTQFLPGTVAISTVSHPPEIHPGDPVRIIRAWTGNLCVVQLPDGMLHRWFAWFELQPLDDTCNILSPGKYAIVGNTTGHGTPPPVPVGTTVRIVRCIPTIFFDVTLSNGEYHRWLAEFELALPIY